MSERKNRVFGILGTIIFHILAIIALIFLGLSTPLPLPGEEGVEVNLGYDETGMGSIQQEEPAPLEEIRTPPPPLPEEEQKEEDIITQDIEEAPVIEEKKEEEKEDAKQEEPVRQVEEITEEEPAEEEPEPEPEPPRVDPRALYKGKSKSGTGGNEGQTGQAGDQGKPTGDPDVSNHDGQGGAGEGISYSLGGRGAKHLPKPSYTSQEQGRIVVTIWVNPEGKVVKADAGARGTNIADLRLRSLTEEAALRSIFQPDPNAPDVQKGTITYTFLRIN